MGLFDAFKKEEVVGTKVLLCSLDARFSPFMNSDTQMYRRLYPATSASVFAAMPQLTQAIAQGYDVVHLYADVSADGTISDASGNKLTGAQLIDACCAADVKVLWMASDNKADAYDKGFNAKGKKINLVMTLRRLGPYFPLFLTNLAEKMAGGEPMPSAWAAMNPQGGGSVQPDAPECIFFAGRGKVILKK
jgi:hypothetical protein